jgi:hypothetical protein
MNFCSRLMMLWQELDRSARKICLAATAEERRNCRKENARLFLRGLRGTLAERKEFCIKVVVAGASG